MKAAATGAWSTPAAMAGVDASTALSTSAAMAGVDSSTALIATNPPVS